MKNNLQLVVVPVLIIGGAGLFLWLTYAYQQNIPRRCILATVTGTEVVTRDGNSHYRVTLLNKSGDVTIAKNVDDPFEGKMNSGDLNAEFNSLVASGETVAVYLKGVRNTRWSVFENAAGVFSNINECNAVIGH